MKLRVEPVGLKKKSQPLANAVVIVDDMDSVTHLRSPGPLSAR